MGRYERKFGSAQGLAEKLNSSLERGIDGSQEDIEVSFAVGIRNQRSSLKNKSPVASLARADDHRHVVRVLFVTT